MAEPLEGRAYLSGLSFSTHAYAVDQNPQDLIVADVNGDGKPDIITANNGGQDVSVLLGNGDGTFKPAINSLVGSSPVAVAAGDFNGDGAVDLAVVNSGDATVSILMGNRDGTFKPAVPIRVGDPAVPIQNVQPFGIAAGDFNHDGAVDLAVATAGDFGPGSGHVAVFLGNGDGAFRPSVSYAAGDGTSDVVAVDLNADGNLDLAASNEAGVSVLLGKADGTFRNAAGFGLDLGPNDLAVGDFNGDVRPDLVTNSTNFPDLGALPGGGDGTLGAGAKVGVGGMPAGVDVGDVNRDGVPDLLTAVVNTNTLAVCLGNGDGTFQAPVSFPVGDSPRSLAAGDFNQDGRLDVVVANEAAGTVSVLLNTTAVAPFAVLSAGGTLTGTGAAGRDEVTVDRTATTIVVTDNAATQVFPVASVQRIVLDMGVGADLLRVGAGIGVPLSADGGAGNDTLIGGDGPETLVGGRGADSIRGGGGGQSLSGGGGNDTIVGAAGDTVDGGGGNDSLTGNGHDVLTGGTGNDTIVEAGRRGLVLGGAGNDLLFALNKHDTASGGGGNDTLSSGGAQQLLLGGGGNDEFINGAGSFDTIDGGRGLNFTQVQNATDSTANIAEVIAPNPNGPFAAVADPPRPNASTVVPADLPTGVLVIRGTAGNDSISVASDGRGDVAATVDGVPQLPVAVAGITGVLVTGGAGDDTIAVDPSVLLPVTLKGGPGNDSLTGGGGANVLVGGAGNDTLVGGPGPNLLVPGGRGFSDHAAGDDLLIGGPTLNNYADFSHRTDASLSLSNDGRPHGGATIMPSVQNIFAGTGSDTVVSTTPGSLLTAGIGNDSLVSGGVGTTLQAGPQQTGVGSDTVQAAGGNNVLLLMNGHTDIFKGRGPTDTVSNDVNDIPQTP